MSKVTVTMRVILKTRVACRLSYVYMLFFAELHANTVCLCLTTSRARPKGFYLFEICIVRHAVNE